MYDDWNMGTNMKTKVIFIHRCCFITIYTLLLFYFKNTQFLDFFKGCIFSGEFDKTDSPEIFFFCDPIAKGLDHIAENILAYLDAKSLCAAELVCKEWYRVISEGNLWKKLIERKVLTDSQWKGLSERRSW